VPVVFVQVFDPVAQGLISSMRQPGGNLTGFSLLEISLGGKWLDLLKNAALGLERVAIMFNPETSPYSNFYMQAIKAAAPLLGCRRSPCRFGLLPISNPP
jgi:putative ABC transport system substrate-binding protein